MNDEKQKTEFWLNLAAYYRQKIPDPVIKMYVYDTKDTPLGELRGAFEAYRQGPQAAFFPLPAVLKNIINPPVDEFAEANECATKIFEAIRKFGYNESQKAREFMGELAWQCVEGMGGYYHFCTSTNMGNDGMVRAQIRDIAKSKIIRANQGRANQLPGQGIKALLPDAPQKSLTAPESTKKVEGLVQDVLKGKSLEGDVRGPK